MNNNDLCCTIGNSIIAIETFLRGMNITGRLKGFHQWMLDEILEIIDNEIRGSISSQIPAKNDFTENTMYRLIDFTDHLVGDIKNAHANINNSSRRKKEIVMEILMNYNKNIGNEIDQIKRINRYSRFNKQ
ncbi:MAG: hypothetical protein Q8910_02815 [Bacteroidota bacterium]|nr:hypothetical protein [Bacteroidota bacterium]